MATLTLNFYNGLREPIEDARIYVSFIDGRSRVLRTEVKDSSQLVANIELSEDPIRDQFTVNASAKGYRDGGFIGLRFANKNDERELHLMLVHRDARVRPMAAREWPAGWAALRDKSEGMIAFADDSELEGACWFNLLEAMRNLGLDIQELAAKKLLAGDKNMGDNRQECILQDRAFVFVTSAMAKAMKSLPQVASETGVLHGKPKEGETRASWKEVRFPEANLQFTLYEKKKEPQQNPVFCDIDMDYFKDKVSHGLLEVFPNTFFGTKTDPRKIYALRWMAGKNSGVDDFAPPYLLRP